MIPDPDTGIERSWTRATTIAGVLPDRYHLELWAQRMIVVGIAKRPDLHLLAQTTRHDDKRKLNNIAKDAKNAADTGAANIGTAIHTLSEVVDSGGDIETLPAEVRPGLYAYADAMRQLKAKVLGMEQIVINKEASAAGTFDRLLQVDGLSSKPIIGDLKTGNTVHFGFLEYAVQLAIYANSTHRFDTEDGKTYPLPDIEKKFGLIFHVPREQSTCEVWMLDLERGWEAAQVAVKVKQMRSWNDLGTKLTLSE